MLGDRGKEMEKELWYRDHHRDKVCVCLCVCVCLSVHMSVCPCVYLCADHPVRGSGKLRKDLWPHLTLGTKLKI